MTPDKPAPDPARIAELKRRLAREPASRSFLELAREYHETGQFEEAAAVCSQGLKYHPNYLSARVLLGRIFFDMGRTDESRSEMESVLSQAPDNLVARKVLAGICLEQGDAEGALDRLRALLAFNPADSETRKKIEEIETLARSKQIAPEPAPPQPEALAGPVEAAVPPAYDVPEQPPPVPAPSAAGEAIEATPAAVVEPPPPPILETLAVGPEAEEPPILELVEEPESVPEALESGVLATPTLAEIYLQQGLSGKAAQVYREILRGDPDNAEARARLVDLEKGGPQVPDPAALARRRKIAALTSWLDSIRRASRARRDAGTPRP